MKQGKLTILGIESSCDDTAAAVLRCAPFEAADIEASVVYDQLDLHAAYGGVVPENAARAHTERLDICTEQALSEAGCDLAMIDLIAVTAGPGLIGGVMAGVSFAKGLALGADKPFIGVNHLAGHALTPKMLAPVAYPYLMLLVSGGHCQFLAVLGAQQFRRIGGTIDDAPGEAFDKVAKMLGLAYPGGPEVEREAMRGDAARFAFPRPLLEREGCDLSFSGLKTALRRARDKLVEQKQGLTQSDRADLCASFQQAVADVLAEKSRRALIQFEHDFGAPSAFAVAGGVAANRVIRAGLEAVSDLPFIAPPLRYCTDNAAMIAYAGAQQYFAGACSDFDLVARPRWPLDAEATAILGGGKRGARA